MDADVFHFVAQLLRTCLLKTGVTLNNGGDLCGRFSVWSLRSGFLRSGLVWSTLVWFSCQNSGTIDLIWLKFCVQSSFGQSIQHTKFQQDRKNSSWVLARKPDQGWPDQTRPKKARPKRPDRKTATKISTYIWKPLLKLKAQQLVKNDLNLIL